MKTINELNLIAGEYNPGDVVVQTSRPGQGKTMFMVFEAVKSALNGNKTLLCSLEVDSKRLEKLAYKSADSVSQKRKLDLTIRCFNPGEKEVLKRLKTLIKDRKTRGKSTDVVFIDSFGLCRTDFTISLKENFEKSFKELKEMAVELQVVFVVNYQMHAQKLFEQEYSKSLENNVDFVFVLEKENVKFKITLIYKKEKWLNSSINGVFDFENVNLFFSLDFSLEEKMIPIIKLMNGMVCIVSSSSELSKKFLIITSEFLSKIGKRVFLLSDISNEDGMNIIKTTKENAGSVFFDKSFVIGNGEFFDKIEHLIDAYEIDTIVVENIDLYCGNTIEEVAEFVEKTRALAVKKKCTIVFETPTRKNIENKDITVSDVTKSHVKVAAADAVIAIRKFRPSLWQRILLWFMFWKPKKNSKITVLKNRHGENFSYFSNIDYNNNKIRIL